MTTMVLPRPTAAEPGGLRSLRLAVVFTLAAWFAVVVIFGAMGAFVAPPGKPPLPIALGVVLPLVAFFAALKLSRRFQEFVLGIDLRLIAAMQAWRWAGLGFLFLYSNHFLPGFFALPAGLGDMAVGITAPWMMLSLARQPGFASSTAFVRWNWLGILDLVVAVGLGGLGGLLATGVAGQATTAPMQSLPLLLIPAYLVPLFLMLHTAALLQSRKLRA